MKRKNNLPLNPLQYREKHKLQEAAIGLRSPRVAEFHTQRLEQTAQELLYPSSSHSQEDETRSRRNLNLKVSFSSARGLQKIVPATQFSTAGKKIHLTVGNPSLFEPKGEVVGKQRELIALLETYR